MRWRFRGMVVLALGALLAAGAPVAAHASGNQPVGARGPMGRTVLAPPGSAPAGDAPRPSAAQSGATPPPAAAAQSAAAVSTWAVDYVGFAGPTTPPQKAFQAAVDIWASRITSSVPINVKATFTDLGSGGILGEAGPVLVGSFTGAQPNTWYPRSLAEAMTGTNIDVPPVSQDPNNKYEITGEFNSNSSVGWYFGTDGNPPAGQIDFESVVLHELGHGLGHIGMMQWGGSCGANTACFPSHPAIYDRFTKTKSGAPITSLSNSALTTAVTTPHNVVFDGGATDAAGGPAVLQTTAGHNDSDYDHLDGDSAAGGIYDGTGDSLMTPALAPGEVSRPGEIVFGMMQDMGYRLAAPAVYQPLVPDRILDTRTTSPLGPDSTITVPVTGVGNVPAGAGAVVLNVTAVNPTAPGYLSVWGAGDPTPATSNLNLVPGQTVPNLVIAKVGSGGRVSLYNRAGTTHVIFDVQGWFPPGAYTGLAPFRALDTRSAGPLAGGGQTDVQVAGINGVDANASAVVVNLTATDPTAPGFLTAWPTGEARPTNTSNVNFAPGQTVPNLAIVKVGSGGKISVFNSAGATHVLVDVQGFFAGGGGAYRPLSPSRILDTRSGAPIGAAGELDTLVLGRGGLPGSGVGAVVLNVTATQPTADGFFTAWPNGALRPDASNLNFVSGQSVPNLVIARVGTGGKVSVYNPYGTTHVIFDVAGWLPV